MTRKYEHNDVKIGRKKLRFFVEFICIEPGCGNFVSKKENYCLSCYQISLTGKRSYQSNQPIGITDANKDRTYVVNKR